MLKLSTECQTWAHFKTLLRSLLKLLSFWGHICVGDKSKHFFLHIQYVLFTLLFLPCVLLWCVLFKLLSTDYPINFVVFVQSICYILVQLEQNCTLIWQEFIFLSIHIAWTFHISNCVWFQDLERLIIRLKNDWMARGEWNANCSVVFSCFSFFKDC